MGPLTPQGLLLRYRVPALVVLCALLGLVTVSFGRLNSDEGWYLLAGHKVLLGQLPFRDFHYTQMPLMAAVLAAWQALAGPGLVGARLFALAAGLGGAAAAAAGLQRARSEKAAFLFAALCCLNLGLVYSLSLVRSQAFTIGMSGLLLWAVSRDWKGLPWSVLLLANLLPLVRLSMLPVVPVTWAWMLRRDRSRQTWIVVGLDAAVLGLAVAWAWSEPAFLYGTLEFHDDFFEGRGWTWETFGGEFLPRWLSQQAGLVALALAATLVQARRSWDELAVYAGICWLLTSAVHMSRTIPYPSYQDSNALFLAVYVALGLAGTAGAAWRATQLFALLGGLMGPLPLSWDGRGGVGRYLQALDAIAEHSSPGARVLTWSGELVGPSGLQIDNRYVMGEFSFLPLMDPERAEQLHLTTAANLLEEVVTARPDLIVCTREEVEHWTGIVEYTVMTPEGPATLQDVLAMRYRVAAEVPAYGQFGHRLQILTRR